MQINTNIAALNTWRALENNQTNMQASLARLSSGQRINSASDDAAGLAVSEKMTAQTRGLAMATRNAQDAVSLVQTADGGANNIQDMLQRMRELSVQASSSTLDDSDRTQLQQEFSSLSSEIDRTATTVQFNGKNLLDGSLTLKATTTAAATTTISNIAGQTTALDTNEIQISYKAAVGGATPTAQSVTLKDKAGNDLSGQFVYDATNGKVTFSSGTFKGVSFDVTGSADDATAKIDFTGNTALTFQVGANQGETITTGLGNLTANALGINSLSIGTSANASTAMDTLTSAINTVSTERAKMGAMQNRLTNVISTLQTENQNLTAANSRIKDVDMASEMANFTKNQVLSQASTAMLAQANQLPQGILSLLR